VKLFLAATLIIMGFYTPVRPQSTQWDALNAEEKEVIRVVIDVFDGMRVGDSATVKRHFYPESSANTAYMTKEGARELKIDDLNNWFNAIGKPHDQLWDERIWDYEVRMDGNLAAVWVRYAFYLDQNFHHCGVDALHLAYDGYGWRIFHLADTRQTAGCEIPPHIADGATY